MAILAVKKKKKEKYRPLTKTEKLKLLLQNLFKALLSIRETFCFAFMQPGGQQACEMQVSFCISVCQTMMCFSFTIVDGNIVSQLINGCIDCIFFDSLRGATWCNGCHYFQQEGHGVWSCDQGPSAKILPVLREFSPGPPVPSRSLKLSPLCQFAHLTCT